VWLSRMSILRGVEGVRVTVLYTHLLYMATLLISSVLLAGAYERKCWGIC